MNDEVRDYLSAEDRAGAERFFREAGADEIAMHVELDSEPAPFRLRAGDQQLPVEAPGVGSHELVVADLMRLFPSSQRSQEMMMDRADLGLRRYGQPLRPRNGRDSRRDAKEEAADLVAYLKTMMREGERVEHHYHAALGIFVGLVEGR